MQWSTILKIAPVYILVVLSAYSGWWAYELVYFAFRGMQTTAEIVLF